MPTRLRTHGAAGRVCAALWRAWRRVFFAVPLILPLLFLSLLFPLRAAANGMGVEDARHLLIRTGFAPTASEVARFAALSHVEGVALLLSSVSDEPVIDPGPDITTYIAPPPRGELSEEEKKARQRKEAEAVRALRAWWLAQMVATPSPLTERMTLFWHNHFVSSVQKVKSAPLMYAQNALFRREALGNFARLLHAAAKSPAMVIYLDAASSRKQQPNENFAREVMELFTLGEGRYTEADIKEAARAFTGWGIDRQTGEFVFRAGQHDAGLKTVLGTEGDLDGDAVLDILLAQQATSEYIVAKLWREFISIKPDKKEAARIARRFVESGYDIRIAVSELLRSQAFWAKSNRGTLIKSPVDYVVGALRGFAIPVSDAAPFAHAAAQMGQVLFAPPNVKGWPGGEAWIDSDTLLKRREFVSRLLNVSEPRDISAMAEHAAAPLRKRKAPRGVAGTFNAPQWFALANAAGVPAQLLVLGTQGDEENLGAWIADARYQVK